jgi:serine/threonine-protein kinase ULK/ATG1
MKYKIGLYEIHNDIELGRGMHSIVYKGYDNNNMPIAVKKIDKINMNEKNLQMLNDEIYVMRLIKENPHNNIVKCYDIIDDLDTVYIILEYCDKGDFRNILIKPLKEKYAKYFFYQIVCGLKHLHDLTIIHRDIKPSNILICNDNTLRICDFGFSKPLVYPKHINITNSLSYNIICGSPLYMAPEIFETKEYGYFTDSWSLGIILFEMLYGYNPFINCKNITELKKMLDKFIFKLPNINKNLSNNCINFINLLLEKNNTCRLSCDKMLIHNWFNENTQDLLSIDNMNIIINEHFLSNNLDDDKSNESDSNDNLLFNIDY